MDFSSAFRRGIWSAVLVLLLASPLTAQIEDHLSAYTGKNAEGYLNPLVSAMGTALNGGIYRSGHIPKTGLNIAIEFPFVGLYFNDDDKYFMGTTEAGFSPETTTQVPTVVGPTGAVIVPGDGGTMFAFPGGFDVGSFAITAPQVRVGSVFGTEAMIRFIAFRIGDSELGDVRMAGFGIRHSISQYMGPVPVVDIAASFFWQDLKLGENSNGEDLSRTKSYSLGAQASKNFSTIFSPYAGLYYNTYKTDITYTSEASGVPENIELSFDDGYVQFTLGLELNLWIFNVWGEYNIAERQSFGAGFGLAL
jgi:hypothetical protein